MDNEASCIWPANKDCKRNMFISKKNNVKFTQPRIKINSLFNGMYYFEFKMLLLLNLRRGVREELGCRDAPHPITIYLLLLKKSRKVEV